MKTSFKTFLSDEYWEPTPWGFGSTHSINYDGPEPDKVKALHRVVEEVTGKPVVTPERKIGFY